MNDRRRAGRDVQNTVEIAKVLGQVPMKIVYLKDIELLFDEAIEIEV